MAGKEDAQSVQRPPVEDAKISKLAEPSGRLEHQQLGCEPHSRLQSDAGKQVKILSCCQLSSVAPYQVIDLSPHHLALPSSGPKPEEIQEPGISILQRVEHGVKGLAFVRSHVDRTRQCGRSGIRTLPVCKIRDRLEEPINVCRNRIAIDEHQDGAGGCQGSLMASLGNGLASFIRVLHDHIGMTTRDLHGGIGAAAITDHEFRAIARTEFLGVDRQRPIEQLLFVQDGNDDAQIRLDMVDAVTQSGTTIANGYSNPKLTPSSPISSVGPGRRM